MLFAHKLKMQKFWHLTCMFKHLSTSVRARNFRFKVKCINNIVFNLHIKRNQMKRKSEFPLKALSTSTSLSLLTKAFECVQCNKSHVWDSNWSLVYYVGHYSHLSFFLWCTIKSYCIVYNQDNPRDFLVLCWFCLPLVWLKYSQLHNMFFLIPFIQPCHIQHTQKKRLQ